MTQVRTRCLTVGIEGSYGFPSLSSTTPLGTEDEGCPRPVNMFAACLLCDCGFSDEFDDSSRRLGISFGVLKFGAGDARGHSAVLRVDGRSQL